MQSQYLSQVTELQWQKEGWDSDATLCDVICTSDKQIFSVVYIFYSHPVILPTLSFIVS